MRPYIFPLYPANLKIGDISLEHLDQLPDLKHALDCIDQTWPSKIWYQALKFLQSYSGSTQTFNKYRTEVERFLIWCITIKKLSPYSLKPVDISDYIEFIADPPSTWIATSIQPHFVNGSMNPKWRPFVFKSKIPGSIKKKKILGSHYSLDKRSFSLAMASLSSFYTFCEDMDLCYSNPVRKARRLTIQVAKDISNESCESKRFNNHQWEILLKATKKLATEKKHHERTLFLLISLKVLDLRVSELSFKPNHNPTFSDFTTDGNTWWLHVSGLRNTVRKISLPNSYIGYLKRYRISRKLPIWPRENEEEPIIHSMRKSVSKKDGVSQGLSTRQLARLIHRAFDEAAKYCSINGLSNDRLVFESATAHMLRGTSASGMKNNSPR